MTPEDKRSARWHASYREIERQARGIYDKHTRNAPVSPEGSEDAVALEVLDNHSHELRFVADLGKWFRWDGHRWAPDRTVGIYDIIRPFVRQAALSLGSTAQQRKAASSAMVAGVERRTRNDRRVAALPEDFDADPWLLNTPGGIVDLRTGEMRPCDPRDVHQDHGRRPRLPGAGATLVESFLAEITGEGIQLEFVDDDQELSRFLQRMSGYMLTGRPASTPVLRPWRRRQRQVQLHHVLHGMMGDYATGVPAETFLHNASKSTTTELADLPGARLVVASEIDIGRRWNEARIK